MLKTADVNVDATVSLYLQNPDNKQYILDKIGILRDQKGIDWLNENFVSEGEFIHHSSILNRTINDIISDLEKAGVAVTTLQNKFIIIEHTQIPSTSPDSLAKCAGDFDLTTIGIDGKDHVDFFQDQTVFIRGTFPTQGVQYDYEIFKPGQNNPVKTNVGTVGADKIILGTFNVALDQPEGAYTAEVKIKGVTDCISFKIVN